MRLHRLEVSWLRNLTSVAVELSPGLNTFFGDNGAGKTALLEAVHLLCRGRSFRTQQSRSLIQKGADQLVVRAVLADEIRGTITLAVSKDRNAKTELKVNGQLERRLSEVARLTPLQVMLPDIGELVFGGPGGRRSWLDWGTFHVKPDYLDTLRDYLRSIRQRNVLLREGADGRTVRAWSEEAAGLGERVSRDRQTYLERLLPHFHRVLGLLAPELQVEARFYRGWGQDSPLDKLLGEPHPREVKYGSTLWGPHRADVQLRLEGSPAASIMSRGQGKMVASALHIAQAAMLAAEEQRTTVFLIDDVGAELDTAHNRRFFDLLVEIGGQVLATTSRDEMGISDTDAGVETLTRGSARVFHVKHGTVHPA